MLSFLSHQRGVIWVPTRSATSNVVWDSLSNRIEESFISANLKVYEKVGSDEGSQITHPIDGRDPAQDFDWRATTYEISQSNSPRLFCVGFDTFEGIYGSESIAGKLANVLTMIRASGDIFVGFVTPSTMSTQRLVDLTGTHVKLESRSGTTMLYAEKPHTEMFSMEITEDNGFQRATLTPMV